MKWYNAEAWIEGPAGRIRAMANPGEAEKELRFINRVHKTAAQTQRTRRTAGSGGTA